MPQLVLFDDAGVELFRGQVDQAHVEAVGAFLRRHIGELRGVAQMVKAYRDTVGQVEQLFAPAIKLTTRSTRPNPRRGRR